MTASHPRKSDRCTRCLSTGHGRARPDIPLSSQIVRQLIEFDATRRSSSNRFTVHRLAGAPRTPFTHLIPRHSNPHSPRRATHVPLPRFPPLEVCVRRPRCTPRHRDGAGIRKPSQMQSLVLLAVDPLLSPPPRTPQEEAQSLIEIMPRPTGVGRVIGLFRMAMFSLVPRSARLQRHLGRPARH